MTKIPMAIGEFAELRQNVDRLREMVREGTSDQLRETLGDDWPAAVRDLATYVDVLESVRDEAAESLAKIEDPPAAPAPAPAPAPVRVVRLNTGIMGNPTEKQGY